MIGVGDLRLVHFLNTSRLNANGVSTRMDMGLEIDVRTLIR
jgi:hypothetical protein